MVTTDNETPVLYDDDAGGNASGDDPAIWVTPATADVDRHHHRQGRRAARLRPGRQEIQSIAATPAPRADGVDGRYNNVDIAYGLTLGGEPVDVAVVSDRYNDQLRFWAIDPAGADAATPLTEVTAPEQDVHLQSRPRRGRRRAHSVRCRRLPAAAGHGLRRRHAGRHDPDRDRSSSSRRAGRSATATSATSTCPPNSRCPTTRSGCRAKSRASSAAGGRLGRPAQRCPLRDAGGCRSLAHQLPLGSREPVLLDRVADFGIHDVFDDESEECVPVDENAVGYGGPTWSPTPKVSTSTTGAARPAT